MLGVGQTNTPCTIGKFRQDNGNWLTLGVHVPNTGHMPSPELMTKREVAELLGLNPKTVNRMVQSGELKPARTIAGTRRPVAMYLFSRTAVERLAKKRAAA